MIYFLFGSDTYRSRQKLHEIIAEFEKKTGAVAGVTRIDAAVEPAAVFEVGRTGSLFSQKELVVIENASGGGREVEDHFRGRLKDWVGDRDLTVVFLEGEVKAEEGLMAAIAKAATKVQEFTSLSKAGIGRWLDGVVAERKVRLSVREKEMLIVKHGSDLWAISNELDKIASGWAISHDIRGAEKIWNFTDAFFRNRRQSFRPMSELLQSGHEPIYLLAALAGSLRVLALVWWGIKTGELKRATAGLHPFVVKKNTELARGLDGAALRELFAELVSADVALKTGKLPPPMPLVRLALRA